MAETQIQDLSATTAVDGASVAPVSRRRLLRHSVGAAAAAAGAVGASVLGGSSAALGANGDPVRVGQLTTGTATTEVRNTSAAANAVALKGYVITAGTGPGSVGVWGQSSKTNGSGVFGLAPTGTGARGVFGQTASGTGVWGQATATTGGNVGVRGVSSSTAGVGVYGTAGAVSGVTYGVLGSAASPAGRGVQGQNTGAGGTGVFGVANTGPNAKGVWGRSTSGHGVFGEATGTSGTSYGVYGESKAAQGVGVFGKAPNIGVNGNGGNYGLFGTGVITGVRGDGGLTGVRGRATGATGTRYGVYGEGGTYGVAGDGSDAGVYGTSPTNGVQGTSNVYGVRGDGGICGVVGQSGEIGVSGFSLGGSTTSRGVLGVSYASATSGPSPAGVAGHAYGTGGIGVLGVRADNAPYAGWFTGNVRITGVLNPASAVLQLDHPDAPGERWYQQALVGSFEQVSVIGGNAVIGPTGQVIVRVPVLFARHHRDIRYQLTLIGSAGAAWVIREVDGRGRFAIGSDAAGARVSWQLTGVRSDPSAAQSRLRVEARKPARYRGRYLQPELYGQRRSLALEPHRRIRRPRAPKGPRTPGA
jgi:hypothetical protein